MAKIINELRHFIAMIVFLVAGIVFLVPAIVAVLSFAIVSTICFLVVAVGGVLGAVCFVPVVFITPGGMDSFMKNVSDEIS